MTKRKRRSQVGGFSGQSFAGFDFSDRDLANSDFADSTLTGCDFENSNLENAEFSDAVLTGCDFTNSDLSGASFRDAKLTGCDFSGADVSGTDFSDADITGCDFSNVDVETAEGLDFLFEDSEDGSDGEPGSITISQSGHVYDDVGSVTVSGNVIRGTISGIVGGNVIMAHGGVHLDNNWVTIDIRGSTNGISQSGGLRSVNGTQFDTRVIDILFFDALLRIESLGGGAARMSLRSTAMMQSGQTNDIVLTRGQSHHYGSPYEARITLN